MQWSLTIIYNYYMVYSSKYIFFREEEQLLEGWVLIYSGENSPVLFPGAIVNYSLEVVKILHMASCSPQNPTVNS